MKSSLKIIVTGLVAQYPVGGVAWDYLQYVLGLARLGHDVYYYEDTWSWPYHPLRNEPTKDGNYSAGYIKGFFQQYAPNLGSHWHYLHLHKKSFGMGKERFNEVARTADLFINVSGACLFPENLSPKCVKVFIDTDPGYNQIILSERPQWSENVEKWCDRVKAHDRHFTYAENIYGTDCLVPKMNFHWKTTRMPIVLDLWSSLAKMLLPAQAPWTTVMSWNAFKGKLTYNGVEYKSKGKEFEKLIGLPLSTGVPFKVAVGGMTTSVRWFERHGFQRTSRLLSSITRNRTLKRLSHYGWEIVDAPGTTLTPSQYQDFIAESYAEISIAKNVYVAMRTGWFSCRSACYLAAGRPVVVQDTGFASIITAEKGLLTFKTADEAVTAIQAVGADYTQHAKAAYCVAEKYFASDTVLTRLISEAISS